MYAVASHPKKKTPHKELMPGVLSHGQLLDGWRKPEFDVKRAPPKKMLDLT